MEPTESTLAVQHWLELHLAGDEAARNALIEVSMRRLRLLARQILTDIPSVREFEETDDLLQNALLRLWKCLAETKPATPIDYYRLAACLIRRELIDLSRRHASHPANATRRAGDSSRGELVVAHNQAAFSPPDDTFDPQRLIQWTEFHEYVEKLPDGERSLFDLIWYQGLSLPEASGLLNIPERTLRRQWNAARVKLGTELLQ